jgi:predicted DNA-binding transcriptional regulator AlpA
MTHSKLIVDWKTLKALGWPYSRAHTWRLMREGRFCQSHKIGNHRNSHPVWRYKDVIGWLETYGLILRDTDTAS